jgi:AcrR family transcriptional regulator
MDAVAVRAGTSRAVLYRRWPSKTELVRDAVAARITQDVRAPDTGSLRGDLVALLENASRTHALTGLALAAKLGPFYPETFPDEREFRTGHLGQETVLNELLERAAREEIEPDLLKPRVRRLVFDLYLHELMTTLRPVPDEVIASIVDDVYLPLVTIAAMASCDPSTSDARLGRATPRSRAASAVRERQCNAERHQDCHEGEAGPSQQVSIDLGDEVDEVSHCAADLVPGDRHQEGHAPEQDGREPGGEAGEAKRCTSSDIVDAQRDRQPEPCPSQVRIGAIW